MTTQEQKTILLVEDQTGTIIIGIEQIQRFGYNVINASTGEHALAIATGNEPPDLILIDILLSDETDGIEVAKWILAKRNIPIVFLSSHKERDIVERVRDISRYGYVLKNSDEFVLQSSIEMAFDLFDANRQLLTALSERKRLEEESARERNLLSTLINTIPDRIYVKDKECRFILNNSAHIQALGAQSQSDVVGKTDHDFRNWESANGYWADDQRVIQFGEAIINKEESIILPSGEDCTILATKVPFRDADGEVIGLVGVSRDISVRKRIEDELKNSEARFKTVSRLSSDFSYSCIHVGGNGYWIDWITDAFYSLTGYSEKDVHEHKNWLFTVHPEDRTRIINQFNALCECEVLTQEFRLLTNSGIVVWINNKMECVTDSVFTGKRRIFGAVENITERKQVEEALRESEMRYKMLADNSLDVIWTMDMAGKFTYFSPSVMQLRGFTPEEILCQSFEEMISGSSQKIVSEKLQLQLSIAYDNNQLVAEAVEVEQPCKDGSSVWTEVVTRIMYDDSGKGCGIIGISRNIEKRKKAEKAMRMSEVKYRTLFDSAGDAIFIHNTEGMLAVNSLACERLGYTQAELMMIPPSGVDSPEQSQYMPERFARLQENGHLTFETEHQRKDGTRVPIEVTSRIISWDSQLAVMSICRDITERKLAGKSLHESEERYRTVVSNADLVTFSTDALGVFTLFEGKGLAKLGLQSGQMVGMSVFDVYAEYPTIIVSMKEALAGCTRRIEIGVQSVVFDVLFSPVLDEHGNVVNVIGMLNDITDRKQAEQLLAQEKERLSVTLRSIGDGVITTDINGTVVMLNKAAEEMTGWISQDAVGRPMLEVFVIINEYTRKPCENPVEKVLSTGNIVELANHTCLISKGGREIQIADSAAPIRNNKSQIIGIVLVFRDMTEKQKLTDSMQRAQKLESLGILAGGIAHDFNNMLGGIFGYLDLAKECAAVNKTDQIQKYLDKAIAVFDRAKGLTQQLLTFSKGGAPVRKTIDIAPLVRHSSAFALSGSNVTCHLDIAPGLWLCDCDETQIGQAIDNIVINAKQAMPMGGKIVITAINVKNVTGHSGNYVRISVKDQGIGLTPDVLPKIFDPFFSTKATGHGLGLATVFSIMQRHNGWVDVQSKLGVGTVFHLFIPASPKTETFRFGNDIVKHTGTGTILVMDDEEFLLEIVESLLQDMGYTVVRAKDGSEALTLFTEAEESGESFAVCILDLTIPSGVGGKAIVPKMRRLHPNAIIIASSGYSDDPVISNPTEHGFTDRIIKPYRKKELTELMMRIHQDVK